MFHKKKKILKLFHQPVFLTVVELTGIGSSYFSHSLSREGNIYVNRNGVVFLQMQGCRYIPFLDHFPMEPWSSLPANNNMKSCNQVSYIIDRGGLF